MAKAARSITSTTHKPKNNNNCWSMGLLESMKDPESVVIRTECLVVVKDKYPKAKFHYLILPEQNINTIYELNKSHLNLLEEFGLLYQKLVEDHKDSKLLAGFHAIPSMKRLHLHVISNDMISPHLKTKRHWNSFTTKFFLPYQDVLNEIKSNGHIKTISSAEHEKLMSSPLKCNQCHFEPKNMPKLKEHLLTHSV